MTRTIALVVVVIASTSCSSSTNDSSASSAVIETAASLTAAPTAPATAAPVPTTAPPTTAPPTTAPPTTAPPTTAPPTTVSALPGILGSYPAPAPGDFPDGVYAVDVTDQDLAAVGEPNVVENHGHYVWTFAQGVWSYEQTADNPLQFPTATGTYSSVGDHVSFYGATDDPGQDFAWVANPDGSLQLTYQASTTRVWSALLGSHPLVPVG